MPTYHATYPRTRTTFRLPFPPPPPIGGAASCALIPAFTASISTPDGSAGEYGDTLLVSCGHGCGGEGTFCRRFVPSDSDIVVFDTDVDFDPPFAGCLPLTGVAGAGVVSVCVAVSVLYGGFGTLSGLSIWIWNEIISKSCFSVGRNHMSKAARILVNPPHSTRCQTHTGLADQAAHTTQASLEHPTPHISAHKHRREASASRECTSEQEKRTYCS